MPALEREREKERTSTAVMLSTNKLTPSCPFPQLRLRNPCLEHPWYLSKVGATTSRTTSDFGPSVFFAFAAPNLSHPE